MKSEISPEQISMLDKVWHSSIVEMQKLSEQVWNGYLEGATTIEISILSIVEKNPDAILKEIIQILGIPASTLTNAVDRLEKRGLLERVISKRDRRSFGLELTDKGRSAQTEHRKGEEILWKRVLGAFDTDEERAEFLRLMQKLVENFGRTERAVSKSAE